MHSVPACDRRPHFESLSALQSFSYSQVDPCSFSQVEHPFSQSTANMHTARTRGDSYNSRSLRRNITAPPGHAQARRKVVNTAVQDYLKSLNSIARSIVLEKETVEKEHNFDWSLMNDSSRDEVVNEHFVPTEVRSQYDGSFIGEWDRSTVTVYNSGDSRQMHMSQPNDWEEAECDELVLRNQYIASHDQGTEELNFSQTGYTPQDIGFPATNIHVQSTTKLHKRQLSFNRQNVIRPAVHCSSPNRDSLGSDGESPRTSDEDSGNPLAFQRSRLRSYSMRPKRGSARYSNTAARSSLRSNHRIRPATPDRTEDHSRPSHYNTSSTNYTKAEPDYDGEIDLPDEELLLDHVQMPDDESTPVHTPVKPPRYSRAKRSPRGPPKLLIEQADSEIRVSHPPSSFDTESIGSLTVPVFSSDDSIRSTEEMVPDSLLTRTWSPSLSSLLDSISIAPSSTQAADDEDDAMSEQSRMTPDSMLSCSSLSYRPRSKAAEMAVMRNPRGKRGGSCYKTTTSEFADRHAQFKPNMLRKQKLDSAQNLACITREPTPTPSIAQEDSLSQSGLLKPPHLTLPNPFSKHNSMTESITTDLPNSPDHLSTVSSLSPPSTPLVQKGHLMQSDDSKRESGYISSSSESFAIKR